VQSNGYAEIQFSFFFSYLAESRRHIAVLEDFFLSVRRDAESAAHAVRALESLFFTRIYAKRRRVVIRRQ
jgi:hypothetical protein